MRDLRTEHERADTHGIVPGKLLEPLAALEGTLLLELGRIQGVSRIAKLHPLPESLGEASLGIILFHARWRARTGDAAGAKDLLVKSLAAIESSQPLAWLRLSLALVRLARRTGNPLPDVARKAGRRAKQLGLPGFAHEFLPFRNT